VDVIKSSRFWLALACVISAVLLAALGKISGGEALGLCFAVLAGFGVAKFAPGSPTSLKVFPLIAAAALLGSACKLTAGANMERALYGVQAAGELVRAGMHIKCMDVAKTCKAASCPAKDDCQKDADAAVQAGILAADALKGLNTIIWRYGLAGAK